MNHTPIDVAIIGAGAAGLAAGRVLSQYGMRIMILEARHRMGGRIFTVKDSRLATPLELGAEFVHGEPAETLDIVRAAGLSLNWLPDNHHHSRNGRLSTIPQFWNKMSELRRNIAKSMNRVSRDVALAEYLKRKNLDQQSRALLLNYAEGYNAAHSTKISSKSLSLEDEENTKQFRLTNGYDQIIEWLRAGLEPSRTEIRLNTIATQIGWKRGDVIIKCETDEGLSIRPIHSHAVIVTIPAALLRAKRLRFIPDIPEQYRSLDKLEPGQVFKVVLQFRSAFWESEQFLRTHHLDNKHLSSALNFVHAEEEDVPVWWTSLPSKSRTLTGWAGGSKAEALLSEDRRTRINKTIDALSRVFGISRGCVDELIEAWWSHDWRDDAFSNAAYTYVGVGGLARTWRDR